MSHQIYPYFVKGPALLKLKVLLLRNKYNERERAYSGSQTGQWKRDSTFTVLDQLCHSFRCSRYVFTKATADTQYMKMRCVHLPIKSHQSVILQNCYSFREGISALTINTHSITGIISNLLTQINPFYFQYENVL